MRRLDGLVPLVVVVAKVDTMAALSILAMAILAMATLTMAVLATATLTRRTP